MQKTVSWLELARITRSGRGWLEVFGVIEPQFLNLLLSDFLIPVSLSACFSFGV